MKTSNVKVRVKDVRQGVTMYTAHPVYGIESYKVMSKPFMNSDIGLFMMVEKQSSLWEGWTYKTKKSLCDAGILPGNSYKGRRTFFKLKHAQAWVKKWATDKGFQESQDEHEKWCALMDDWDYSDY